MKRKVKISIFPLLIMGIFLVVASSCEKDNESNNPLNGQTTAVFNPSVTYSTMTDQDGNEYKTVTIGTQTWMAENLRTTKYNDGTAIPNVTNNDEWLGLTTGAYCNYDNTSDIVMISTYGRLYNWYAVNTGKLAPKGWHVPTDAEWTQLVTYLGGESISGGKLKETGNTHWLNVITGATNETGFTALPGGGRRDYGEFNFPGYHGNYWSTTEHETTHAWYHYMLYINNNGNREKASREVGFSVRCLMD